MIDGALIFEGRADTQIKVRGHRVDMAEVDMAIKKVKGVDKVTILCYNPGEVNQVRDSKCTAQARDDAGYLLTVVGSSSPSCPLGASFTRRY